MKNFTLNKEQYINVCIAWKAKTSHSASHHIIYNLLRSFDMDRGFTPITNRTKLSNGVIEWTGYREAKHHAYQLLKKPVQYRSEGDIAYEKRLKSYIVNIELFGITYDESLINTMSQTIGECIK